MTRGLWDTEVRNPQGSELDINKSLPEITEEMMSNTVQELRILKSKLYLDSSKQSIQRCSSKREAKRTCISGENESQRPADSLC